MGYKHQLFSLHNFIWCLKGHSQQALLHYNMQQKQLLIVFSWAAVMGKRQHNPVSVHSPL